MKIIIIFIAQVFLSCCILLTTVYAQTNASMMVSPTATAPSSLFDNFEGRIPCQEIAAELNLKVIPACNKRKIRLILHYDAVSHSPTSYELAGMGEKSGKGNWHIVKGTPTDPQAIVYQLDLGDKVLYLLKGDENVLFVLDRYKNFLPGNAHFSYTLNRIRNIKSWDHWLALANKGLSF